MGAAVTDLEDGTSFHVRANQVVNATGVWADDLRDGAPATPSVTVRASKGSHIVVARDRIEADGGIIVRTRSSVLLVIPWGPDHWLIGTTDTDPPAGEPKEAPVPTEDEIGYLLDEVNTLLATPLTRADVIASFAGLRPLVSGDASTARLSREHVVSVDEPGLVTISGGKFTTYRVMAVEVIDQVVAALRQSSGVTYPSSCTAAVPLVGAEGLPALQVAAATGAFPTHGLPRRARATPPAPLRRVRTRRGAAGRRRPDARETPWRAHPATCVPRSPTPSPTRAPLHLDDVMLRRTRIAMEYPDHGEASATEVAGIMAPLLGWSAEELRSRARRLPARGRCPEAGADNTRLADASMRPQVVAHRGASYENAEHTLARVHQGPRARRRCPRVRCPADRRWPPGVRPRPRPAAHREPQGCGVRDGARDPQRAPLRSWTEPVAGSRQRGRRP